MAEGTFIAYYRVSTQKQGDSGLGLESQKATVKAFLKGATPLAEYVEVESGKRHTNRPELTKAINHCSVTGSKLLLAKLDRLSRNLHFISGLMESKVDFVAADCPQANKFTLHILAAVAEHETALISQRTKEALKAAKARGVKLGNPKWRETLPQYRTGHLRGGEAVKASADKRAELLRGAVESFLKQNIRSYHGIADALNTIGFTTPRNGKWYASSAKRLLIRLKINAQECNA